MEYFDMKVSFEKLNEIKIGTKTFTFYSGEIHCTPSSAYCPGGSYNKSYSTRTYSTKCSGGRQWFQEITHQRIYLLSRNNADLSYIYHCDDNDEWLTFRW